MKKPENPILPSVKRRAAAASESRTKFKPEHENVKAVAEKFKLPQHLARHFMRLGIITNSGDTHLDTMILWALSSLERDRRFCRYVMSKFSTNELTDLINQAGMDNLDVLLYNILKQNPGISTDSLLATLFHIHGIEANKLVRSKIPILRRRISNQKYRLKKKIDDALGSEANFNNEKAARDALKSKQKSIETSSTGDDDNHFGSEADYNSYWSD